MSKMDRRKFLTNVSIGTSTVAIATLFPNMAIGKGRDAIQRTIDFEACKQGGFQPYCGKDKEFLGAGHYFIGETSPSEFRLPGLPIIPHTHRVFLDKETGDKFTKDVLDQIGHSILNNSTKDIALKNLDLILAGPEGRKKFGKFQITAPSDPKKFIEGGNLQTRLNRGASQALTPFGFDLDRFAAHNHMAEYGETDIPAGSNQLLSSGKKGSHYVTYAALWRMVKRTNGFAIDLHPEVAKEDHKLYFLRVKDHSIRNPKFPSALNAQILDGLEKLRKD